MQKMQSTTLFESHGKKSVSFRAIGSDCAERRRKSTWFSPSLRAREKRARPRSSISQHHFSRHSLAHPHHQTLPLKAWLLFSIPQMAALLPAQFRAYSSSRAGRFRETHFERFVISILRPRFSRIELLSQVARLLPYRDRFLYTA